MPPKSVSLEQLLRRIALFAQLDDASIARLAVIAVRRSLVAGTRVVRQGEQDGNLYAIAEGLLQVSVPTVDGREIVLSLLRQGDVFGEVNLFDDKKRSANVSALQKVDLLVFTKDDFLSAIRQCPEIGLSMLSNMAALVRRLTTRAEELSALPVPTRLAKKLLEIAEICGTPIDEKQVALPAALSQQQLANHVQATRESVNKSLSVWIKDGLIHRTRSQIVILDRTRLAELGQAPGTDAAPLLAVETEATVRPAAPVRKADGV